MIVVDTTVWIDFFEARGTPFDRHLVHLIELDAPVALTDVVYGEVLQGIREDATYRQTRRILRAFPVLRARGLPTFERAANIYRAARRQGITIRSTIDCLIAATCLEWDAELLHNDQDFDRIAGVAPLRVHARR